jgi:ribosome biogenesis GTPase
LNSLDRLSARQHALGTTPTLADLGWNPQRAADYAAHAAVGLLPGRVARVDRGLCDVLLADPAAPAEPGRNTLRGQGPGPDSGPGQNPDPDVATRAVRADWSALGDGDPINNPCTGDWALVDVADPAAPVLRALLPRHTAVVRGATGERSDGQVLGANIDHVLIAVSLAAKADVGRIERLLALAWESGAQPVVVLTKADAAYDPLRVAEVEAAAPGATVLTVSALTGEGVDVLAAVLAGGSAALIGQSGVGKSTLTNALAGAEVMATSGTRETDEKGRHTTTTRELIPLPGGGVLIDTPGLRGVGLFGGESGLAQTFSDIEEFAEQCRFADCAHEGEPGCAVLAAVADGTVPERRLASYRKLLRENEWIASRTDARLAAERRQEWKRRSREANKARP